MLPLRSSDPRGKTQLREPPWTPSEAGLLQLCAMGLLGSTQCSPSYTDLIGRSCEKHCEELRGSTAAHKKTQKKGGSQVALTALLQRQGADDSAKEGHSCERQEAWLAHLKFQNNVRTCQNTLNTLNTLFSSVLLTQLSSRSSQTQTPNKNRFSPGTAVSSNGDTTDQSVPQNITIPLHRVTESTQPKELRADLQQQHEHRVFEKNNINKTELYLLLRAPVALALMSVGKDSSQKIMATEYSKVPDLSELGETKEALNCKDAHATGGARPAREALSRRIPRREHPVCHSPSPQNVANYPWRAGWLQDGYRMATGWLQDGYRMAAGWRHQTAVVFEVPKHPNIWDLGPAACV